ncbi:Pentatricopeptide repeat-containing protein mitochondrial [Zea mays]|nr:Pentatricopeptide repeat-containing protein mitochondrial [Zea mays]AQK92512.1 Pentatricopeptide repeat-containing protein mitochondrial [Zea mays]AQK92514.1 Pentatricopeptide repeat-containing protein mitochondrial [Zea mays]
MSPWKGRLRSHHATPQSFPKRRPPSQTKNPEEKEELQTCKKHTARKKTARGRHAGAAAQQPRALLRGSSRLAGRDHEHPIMIDDDVNEECKSRADNQQLHLSAGKRKRGTERRLLSKKQSCQDPGPFSAYHQEIASCNESRKSTHRRIENDPSTEVKLKVGDVRLANIDENINKPSGTEREGIEFFCGPDDGTKEQDMALRKAYFSARPSPHFWKRVSKMVPGRSAEDCFNRIYTDLSTPTPIAPRPRANSLGKHSGRSSARKKPFSRLRTKSSDPSPGVLKPIKNVILHERYIDKLARREGAKRPRRRAPAGSKAADSGKSLSEQQAGSLKAAKNALISEATDFISSFKTLQANSLAHAVENSEDEIECDASNCSHDDKE